MVDSTPELLPYESLLAQTRWLGRLARELVPAADREDLVQDVLLVALRRRAAERPVHLRGWLATVARNLAWRRRVRESNRRVREQSIARAESEVASAADQVAAFAVHQAVVNAVMELEEPYRRTLLLRFWDDLPTREVAQRMGVPVETARTRIKRGVQRLRARLDRHAEGRAAWLIPLMQVDGVRESCAASAGVTGAAAGLLISIGVLSMKKAVVAVVLLAALVITGIAMWNTPLTGDGVSADATPTLTLSQDARSASTGPADGPDDVNDARRTILDVNREAELASATGDLSIRVVTRDETLSSNPRVVVTVESYYPEVASSQGAGSKRCSVELGSVATFRSLPYGVYRVDCDSRSLGRGNATLVLSESTASATVELEPSESLHDQDFTLIVREADGKPAAGARLRLTAWAETAKTPEAGRVLLRFDETLDEDGIWIRRGLRMFAGSLLVEGDEGRVAAARVAQHETMVLTLREPGLARVVVEERWPDDVRRGDGDAASSRPTVEFHLARTSARVGLRLSKKVDVNGRAVMRLAPGRYSVLCRGESAHDGVDFVSVVAPVVRLTIEAGGVADVRILIDHTRGIRGVVTAQAGCSTAGVRAVVSRRFGSGLRGSPALGQLKGVRLLMPWALKQRSELGQSYSCKVVGGRYSFVGLSPGFYHVDIIGSDSASSRTTCDLTAPGIIELSHTLDPSGGIYGKTHSLYGFLEFTKRRSASAPLLCEVGEVFHLRGVPAGDYAVTAIARTGARYEMPDVTVRPGKSTFANISPRLLGPKGVLRGRVTRHLTGVERVSVGIESDRRLTSPSGEFEFPVWPHAGMRTFTISERSLRWRVHSSIHGQRSNIELGANDVRLSFSSPDGMPRDGTLWLRYVDGPIRRSAGDEVRLDSGTLRFERGVVELRGLYRGEYAFRASLSGGGISVGEFRAEDGDREFLCNRMTKVRIRVVGGGGGAIVGASVTIKAQPGLAKTTGVRAGYIVSRYSFHRSTDRAGRIELDVPVGGLWISTGLPRGWPSKSESRSATKEIIVGASAGVTPIVLTLR